MMQDFRNAVFSILLHFRINQNNGEWRRRAAGSRREKNENLDLLKHASHKINFFQFLKWLLCFKCLCHKKTSLLWSDCWVDWIGTKVVFFPPPPPPPFWHTLSLLSFSDFKGNCKKSRNGEDKGKHQRHQSWSKLGASVTSIHNDHVGGMKGRQGRRECHGKKKKSSFSCAHVCVSEVHRAQGRCSRASQASGPAQGGLRGRAGRGAHCGAAEPCAWRPPSAGLLLYNHKGWGS